MTLKAGWLNRQFERVNEEIRDWPSWMRREAGFTEPSTTSQDQTAAAETTAAATASAANAQNE